MSQTLFNPVQIQLNRTNDFRLYAQYKPSENLRKYIYCYWTSPSPVNSSINHIEPGGLEVVIPDGCIDVLLGTDKDGHSCRNILVGTMSRAAFVNMDHNNIHTFGIRFYPGGLQAFIKESAREFTDKMESIDDIEQDVFIDFFKGLSRISDVHRKISFANQYFTLKMKNIIPYEDRFQNMLYRIYNSKGIIHIKDIAEREVISEKQMTRIFYNRAGISTKAFTRIVRFQNVLKLINITRDVRVIDIALEGGYYDQSHFIRNFYDFSGISPAQYLKSIIKE